jgi:hypothetical protein
MGQEFINAEDVWLCAPDALKGLLDGSPGLRNGFFALGDADDPATPGIVMLQIAPGHVLERHAHDCFRFETVVTGSLYVGDRVLRPGDVMIALPGEHYGPHTAGPEGVTTCEVFSSFQASFKPTFESPDGSSRAYDFLAGDIPAEEVWEWNRRDAPVVEV